MRKILAILLVLSLLTLPAWAAEPTLTVEQKTALPGDTVTIVVTMANNPGIWGIDAKIGYDKTVLTLTEVKNGEIFADGELTPGVLSNAPYTLSYEKADLSNTTKSGILATLTFAVKAGAALGNYPITVSYNTGDCINIDEQKVSFRFQNGGIRLAKAPTAKVTGGSISYTLPKLEGSGSVFVAQYRAGRMTGLQSRYVADLTKNNDGTVTFSDALPGAVYRVFLLRGAMPLCGKWEGE